MGFETSADSYWNITRMLVSKLESRTSSFASSNGDPNPHGGGPSSSRHIARGLDFMPLEVDCDYQCSHSTLR